MPNKIISKNQKETEKIAQDFLDTILKKECKNACVVGLSGDLGTGKTTFTQSVAKLLGIKGKIKSPTFVIMKRYPLSSRPTSPSKKGRSGGFKNLFHLDAYRLKNAEELFNLGWKEIISNPEHLVLIEWPENVKKAMPKKHHKILIAHTKEGHRSFKIKQ
ncbi:MAG: tRNA (adenosine(37)-N6)-threonylcarbamoyltransferase complex ATPase subunit type 1 TsaE [Minisyncoccia bacterium]